MQPIPGIHNPKNIHDTMGWKPNFQLPHQIFCNSCQNTQKPWTYINIGKNKNQQKEWKCFSALPLHWFSPNDLTTTKTYFVTYDGKIISKS
jgi:hypothetical protein